MKYILPILIVFILYSCINKETGKVALDVKWKVEKNLATENGESQWLIKLKNLSDNNLAAGSWSLYFNTIATLRAPEGALVSVAHVNGDLRVLKPNADFKELKKGESIDITLYSNISALSKTDAPLGFYIVFDDNLDEAIACDMQIIELPKGELIRNKEEVLPVYTPQVAFEENKAISLLSEDEFCPIVPTPKEYSFTNENLLLKDKIVIKYTEEFSAEAKLLKEKLGAIFTGELVLSTEGEGDIFIAKNKNLDLANEAYSLKISNDGINIEASTNKGVFYGTQTLLALIPVKYWANPGMELSVKTGVIYDEPRFEYRGLFLDVARNFQPKENVLKLLDVMALYKINKFHFHICDDEGWRLEINDLPELTEFGAYRGYSKEESKYLMPSFGSGPIADPSVSHGSGYYTREDFIEILQYASARHIEVIPEIDMPGHARAAIRSMQIRYNKYMELGQKDKATEYLLSDPDDKSEYKSVQGWTDNVINVAQESTYKFLEKVTDEVIVLFKEADAPLTCIHTGGDEVPHGIWEKSPVCNSFLKNSEKYNSTSDLAMYFVKRFSDILQERKLVAAGWEEIALLHEEEVVPNPEFVGKNLRPFVWNNMWNSGVEDIGYQLANAGYPVVLANVTNMYFDLAYHKNPNEPGYYWGNFIDTKRPWEYTPNDITKCADYDRFGHAVDRDKLLKGSEALTADGKENILGIQGLLWSENNLGLERMEYFIFPKLLGLAERAWAAQPEWANNENNEIRKEQRELAWVKFANTLGQNELPRLDYYNGGVAYRVPTPGAIIEEGKLKVNIRYPGFEVRYTMDNTEPSINSELYTEPVEVNGTVKLKAFTSSGRASYAVILP